MNGSQIDRLVAREVLDSRGDPTVEVEAHLASGAWGRAIVPAGASTGQAEALELRDRDAARYDGRGVRRAVAHVVGPLAETLRGVDAIDQRLVDRRLCACDGTPNKSRLGGNAILSASLAVAQAAAALQRVPLYEHIGRLWQQVTGDARPVEPRVPLPMTNMISGGLHAGRNIDYQDFLILPRGAPDYATGLEWIVRVSRRLGRLLAEAGFEGRLVGDEGGYGPRLPNNRAAAEFIVRAIEAAGLRPGEDVTLAIDVASTHFWDGTHYRLHESGDAQLTSDQMIDALERLVRDFPVTSIEDGLAEEDWDGWRRLTDRLGSRVALVGDDLFATRVDRLERGIGAGVANSVLIKLNQVGTLSETLDTMRVARAAGYGWVVSARSGESEDTTMVDLAVGTASPQIKIGAIQRSERLAKYNAMLRTEERLRGG